MTSSCIYYIVVIFDKTEQVNDRFLSFRDNNLDYDYEFEWAFHFRSLEEAQVAYERWDKENGEYMSDENSYFPRFLKIEEISQTESANGSSQVD